MAETSNHVYNEIALEIETAVYRGAKLPKEFSITLTDAEFAALLAGGIQWRELQVPTKVTELRFEIAGLHVTIFSEVHPVSWSGHH